MITIMINDGDGMIHDCDYDDGDNDIINLFQKTLQLNQQASSQDRKGCWSCGGHVLK